MVNSTMIRSLTAFDRSLRSLSPTNVEEVNAGAPFVLQQDEDFFGFFENDGDDDDCSIDVDPDSPEDDGTNNGRRKRVVRSFYEETDEYVDQYDTEDYGYLSSPEDDHTNDAPSGADVDGVTHLGCNNKNWTDEDVVRFVEQELPKKSQTVRSINVQGNNIGPKGLVRLIYAVLKMESHPVRLILFPGNNDGAEFDERKTERFLWKLHRFRRATQARWAHAQRQRQNQGNGGDGPLPESKYISDFKEVRYRSDAQLLIHEACRSRMPVYVLKELWRQLRYYTNETTTETIISPACLMISFSPSSSCFSSSTSSRHILNVQDSAQHRSPVHHALRHGKSYLAEAKWLIHHSPTYDELYAVDCNGQSALSIAREGGYLGTVLQASLDKARRYWRNHSDAGSSVEHLWIRDQLVLACRYGIDLDIVRAILDWRCCHQVPAEEVDDDNSADSIGAEKLGKIHHPDATKPTQKWIKKKDHLRMTDRLRYPDENGRLPLHHVVATEAKDGEGTVAAMEGIIEEVMNRYGGAFFVADHVDEAVPFVTACLNVGHGGEETTRHSISSHNLLYKLLRNAPSVCMQWPSSPV